MANTGKRIIKVVQAMTPQIMYSYTDSVLRVFIDGEVVLEETLSIDMANERVKELYNIDPQIKELTTPN
jgi:hypothetical protein